MRALDDVVVSAVARVEVPAAILRKQRLGELAPADADVLLGAFELDWFGDEGPPRFAVVAVTHDVLEAAVAAVAAHALRAYDALQLASALVARDAEPDLSVFACFDRPLAAAAHAEGFALVS